MSGQDDAEDQTQSFFQIVPGVMISHYKIIEKIGAGGMGEVYLAQDTELDRKVALKFLPPHLCRDEDCRKRFKREAQAAAKLDHPNIVPVHGVSEHQGRPYFAMAHIEGQSLRDVIKEGKLSTSDAIDLSMQICEGLQEAHEAGVIHRDVKPSNIILDSKGRPRLLDFGLAMISSEDKLTKTGSTLGTVGYMSPEQVAGKKVDHRSDMFSAGVILYEMLTGRRPFEADNDAAILRAITDSTPEPVARYKTGVPEELQRIVSKLLEKTPALRYQHAGDFLADLKKAGQQPEAGLSKEQPSIAVLPFVNLSADPEQEYFCDGISEEIINVLTQLEELKVVARTSCFAFKGKNEDVREIGRKLAVNHVLEGSVRKAGNRIRITSQLINVDDGYHLWSEKFDRDLEDIFAIQDEISLAIVDRLKVKLVDKTKSALVKRYTDNVEAYGLYLKGRHYWNSRTAENIEKALACFRQVITLDPDYALAHAGIADCYTMMAQVCALSPKEAFAKAKAAALRALDLDSELTEATATLGGIKLWYEWDYPGAETLFKRAIQINPNYASVRQWYAMYLSSTGRHQEAFNQMKKAQELDPLSFILKLAMAVLLFEVEKYAEAEEECREATALEPDNPLVHSILSVIYEGQGNYDRAVDANMQIASFLWKFTPQNIERLRTIYSASGWTAFLQTLAGMLTASAKNRYISGYDIASYYARLNDRDKAFEWLEKAFQDRDFSLIYLPVSRAFINLHSDSRFVSLLGRMGIKRSE